MRRWIGGILVIYWKYLEAANADLSSSANQLAREFDKFDLVSKNVAGYIPTMGVDFPGAA